MRMRESILERTSKESITDFERVELKRVKDEVETWKIGVLLDLKCSPVFIYEYHDLHILFTWIMILREI